MKTKQEKAKLFAALFPEAATRLIAALTQVQFDQAMDNWFAQADAMQIPQEQLREYYSGLTAPNGYETSALLDDMFRFDCTPQGGMYWVGICEDLIREETLHRPSPAVEHILVSGRSEKVEASTTSALLTTRETTHGSYSDTALYSQTIKSMVRGSANYNTLSNQQRESLDMIAVKIGRILSGNPDEQDHWKDIAGYATLAVNS